MRSFLFILLNLLSFFTGLNFWGIRQFSPKTRRGSGGISPAAKSMKVFPFTAFILFSILFYGCVGKNMDDNMSIASQLPMAGAKLTDGTRDKSAEMILEAAASPGTATGETPKATGKNEGTIPYGDGCKKHAGFYHYVDNRLVVFVGYDKMDAFTNRYGWGEENNIVNFVKFCDLDKDTFNKLIAYYQLNMNAESSGGNGYHTEIIYSDDQRQIEEYYAFTPGQIPNSETKETIANEKMQDEAKIFINPFGYECKVHAKSFHHIDERLIEFVGRDKMNQFVQRLGWGEEHHIVHFVIFCDISKGTFKKLIDAYDLKGYDVDTIYSIDKSLIDDVYGLSSNPVGPAQSPQSTAGTETNIDFECQKHKWFYHTIPNRLIQYVGDDKMEAFVNQYGWREEHNIVNFVNFCKLDKNIFTKLKKDLDLDAYAIASGKTMYDIDTIYSGDQSLVDAFYGKK